MKKRLNIITFLFIGIIILATVLEVYLKSDNMFKINRTSDQIEMEFHSSEGNVKDESKRDYESFSLRLNPDKVFAPDSLYNEKTGKWMLSCAKEVNVYIKKDEIEYPYVNDIIVKLLFVIIAVAGSYMLIVNFVKILISVNRSVIFDWINVRRLRKIGTGLILIFIADAIISIYESVLAIGILKISNYSIIMETFSENLLIEGMIAFIIAEIFAVGLRLKEEQDLTI